MPFAIFILFILSACGSEPSQQGKLENNLAYQQKNISRAIGSLPKTTQLTGTTTTWLDKNRDAFAHDILHSKHQWIENGGAKCASSNASPLAPIKLSPSRCKERFVSENIIVADLMVLSMNHLGLLDPNVIKINLKLLLGELGLTMPLNYDLNG